MRDRIVILGYGSLIWDLDDLAPKVRGDWHMAAGPALPLEFSRISPKRQRSLVVVIDEQGDPCPTHAIESAREDMPDAIADLTARERTKAEDIGWVDRMTGTAYSRRAGIAQIVAGWCALRDVRGAVWTDLTGNFKAETGTPFTTARAIAYLKTLEGESLASALTYINSAPTATNTPLRRALSADPWWQGLSNAKP